MFDVLWLIAALLVMLRSPKVLSLKSSVFHAALVVSNISPRKLFFEPLSDLMPFVHRLIMLFVQKQHCFLQGYGPSWK